jgi:hypothetical protein
MAPTNMLGLPDVVTSGCEDGVEIAFLGDEDAEVDIGDTESAGEPGRAVRTH